jgi:thiosulfate dehydrogenase [quinone] large subunit
VTSPTPEFSAPPRSWREWPAWARATPGGSRLPLRAFLGVTFCVAGLQKLANPAFFRSSDPSGIEAQMRLAEATSPLSPLLGPALHVAALIGVVIAVGELAVGTGTLLGFKSRIAAGGGTLLSLSFFLTVSWSTSPYYYGADIVFLFAWTPFLLSGAGAFSLDAYLAGRARQAARSSAKAASSDPAGRDAEAARRRELARRTVIGRLGASGVVSAVIVAVGGIAALIGRAASTPGEDFAAIPGSRPASRSAGTGSGSSRRIGLASEIPVGEAAPFTFDSLPAYVVRPSPEEFLGFSRICTHEGCTVNYVHSLQEFQCPCHGSLYSALTGEVLRGPAPRPLPRIPIRKGPDGELIAD